MVDLSHHECELCGCVFLSVGWLLFKVLLSIFTYQLPLSSAMEEGWIVESAAERHGMVMVKVDDVYYYVECEATGGWEASELGESFGVM